MYEGDKKAKPSQIRQQAKSRNVEASASTASRAKKQMKANYLEDLKKGFQTLESLLEVRIFLYRR